MVCTVLKLVKIGKNGEWGRKMKELLENAVNLLIFFYKF